MATCCSQPSEEVHNNHADSHTQPPTPGQVHIYTYFGTGIVILALWWLAYSANRHVADWISYHLFSLPQGSRLGAAIQFFFYDTVKILLLLILMVYVIGWLRASLQVERVRDYLAGKRRAIGYFFGSAFGAITPFCSCSSIPLFLGFTTARIPIGITMAFLITSPLINEIAVVLLWGLLGWKFTLVYIAVGMFAGALGGIIMDAVRAERWLQSFLLDTIQSSPVHAQIDKNGQIHRMGLMERHNFALAETSSIVRRVWTWVIIGVGLGAALHGFVPEDWFANNLGAGQWWSVPVAVALGIPLYTNVTGIVPVMESLLMKGLPVGTTLAFCMATVAASLPEVFMLKQVMRWQLLALFLGVLLVIFTLVGWFFNAIQHLIF
ncbi:MAG: permease [Desulfobulbaceae bacterium]|nr:permease [Desulfobulbaceae bacterium]